MNNVFFYSEDKSKKAQIAALCKKMRIPMDDITPGDISRTVADITGLPAVAAIPYPSGIPSKTPTTAFYRMPELMLFAGLDAKKINQFLDSFKKEGISPVICKAMVTPYSMGWTLYELIEHLKLEAAGVQK